MYKTGIVFVFCLLHYTGLLGQSGCACCSKQHHQFDFWLGQWEVVDDEGKLLGHNHIEKLEQGCIISEHWEGANGITGRSYNYYDAENATWNQIWIDSQGNHLQLKGSASDNQMVLESKAQDKPSEPSGKNRITWTANENGTVTQLWELLDSSGAVKHTVFKGIYRKKTEKP
ncbi:hypothetical protein GCM10028791_18530 [Echinicola sediminis]